MAGRSWLAREMSRTCGRDTKGKVINFLKLLDNTPHYLEEETVSIATNNANGTIEARGIGGQEFVPELVHYQLAEIEDGLPDVYGLVE